MKVRVMAVHPIDAFYDTAKIVGNTGELRNYQRSPIPGYLTGELKLDKPCGEPVNDVQKGHYFLAIQVIELRED